MHSVPIRASLVGVALVALFVILFWPSDSGDRKSDTELGLDIASPAPTEASNAVPSSQSAAVSMAGAGADPEPLWWEIDESAVRVLPPYGKGWTKDGRALVKRSADLDETRNLRVGDRLTLSLPQLGRVQSSAVDEVSLGPGARTLTGRTAWGDGLPRRWVVTVGPSSLFAWIDTPEGPHELAIRDQHSPYGWLLPSANKMAGFDFSRPDYFMIDEHGRRVIPDMANRPARSGDRSAK